MAFGRHRRQASLGRMDRRDLGDAATLAEVDSSWVMRLTEQSRELRRSLKGARGMRLIPGVISDQLAGCELSRAPLTLPPSVFGPALKDYRDAARRRADRERDRGSRRRWWWPTRSGVSTDGGTRRRSRVA